ncbi:MAG: GHKL domain-containing protein [Anaerolineales bacterium]|nr:GHKL domain-containing protein [Anaerolineales bacterium]
MIKDRTIGVLSVQAREANAYTDAQIRMLETLATQVAITVDKSRLFDQLQQELLERKRAEAEARLLNTELEERVRVRTAQLEGANKELESFSYSVSHDLRAPLRGIDGFSFILEQEYASRLDETGQRYLYRIRESVQRMNQLINDLLTFSRLGRQELHKRPIVLLPLVQDVLSDLQPEFSGRQVDITLANDFPICEADPNLLRQVFANILGNALKYSRKRDETRIEVNWKNTDGEVVYYIRDNGVGFDMQYADKLFSVFYRLHRVEEFEGSGVGLATVHRIITRHGGRIWVEAEVDKGATFYFTLTAGE